MINKRNLFILLFVLLFNTYFSADCSKHFLTPIILSPEENKDDIPTRALKITTTEGAHSEKPVDFGPALFNQNQSTFYLGAKNTITDDNLKTFSISSVNLSSAFLPIIKGIMPQNLANEAVNALYGANILNLALFKNSALVVNSPADQSTNQIIYFVQTPNQGGNIIEQTLAINDAAGAGTNEIKTLATSDTYIFAAVSATNKAWDDNSNEAANRGIAIIYPDYTQKPLYLRILDATNINNSAEGNKAAILSLLATDELFAFRKTGAGITNAIFNPEPSTNADVSAVWSNDLQRLFVATTDLTRDNQTLEGGILSIAVGRIENNSTTNTTSLTFSPIIANPATMLPANETSHIIGFYYNTTKTDPSKVSTKQMKLMHTSTNKYYLITHSTLVEKTINIGGATSVEGTDGVFALPLITTNSDPKLIGTVTVVPDINDPKFTVGTNEIQTSINDSDAVTDIFVHGDSVYVCLGSQSDPNNLGIYQSTAIFGANGDIIAWTLWQRVMGSIQKVWHGDVDYSTNNFYFLSSQTPSIADQTSNTVQITQWNTTELANANIDGSPNNDHNLSSLLAQIFPQSEGGIFQIFDFDDQTNGFAKGNFSMMVVVGHHKVAIVQTSQMVEDVLQPITKFEIGTNVLVFSDDSLQNIAPLCCAEVSRMTNTNSGWLFIGGLGGIVALNKANNGWDAATGLTNITDLNGYSFKKLTPSTGSFANIRKIVCQDSKTWVETKDSLYSFNINTNSFITGNTNETTINPNLPSGTKYSDMLVIPGTNNNRFFILATTAGLYSFRLGEAGAYKVGNISDPAVHLNYLSMIKGGISSTGNLYVLYSNFVDEIGKVYRYNVTGSTSAPTLIQAITTNSSTDGFFVDLHYYRGNFVTDGSFGYSELGKGIGYSDMFHMYEITTNPSDENYNLTNDASINPNENWYIGTLTKNSASGSILLPGDWGLIVNE